jgi:GDSL-like Lipase/Acylhydrolase family
VRRVTLFAKANVDVHDSLHSCRLGGELAWNGINDALRATGRPVTIRLRHETMTRSDALLRGPYEVPVEIKQRNLPLGAYPAQSQFSSAIFDTAADAIIFSIQPDVASGMVQHKSDGYLIYPNEVTNWSVEDRTWLKTQFEPVPRLSPADAVANFRSIIDRIREKSEAPILIYNLSPIIPNESVHCYLGLSETLSTRIRKFNLALVELSEETGISIVDVDSIIARQGADELKIDAMHLTPAGYRLVAHEVIRLLDELGLFDD